MKRLITILNVLAGLMFTQLAHAQTYTKTFSNNAENAIEFSLSRSSIDIEGYSGNEVVIENTDYEAPPERAQGLRPLYGGGQDNTGIGLSVEEEDGVLKIVQAAVTEGNFVVKIPNNVRLMIEEVNWGGGDIEVSNHNGEIEVKSKNGDVSLQNITGPVILGSTSGDVDIVFSRISDATPSSISLISGYIDVTVPPSEDVDFVMSSISGEIYTDLNLQMDGEEDNMERLGGGKKIQGSLNGGGVEVGLKTISGDIYLRKK